MSNKYFSKITAEASFDPQISTLLPRATGNSAVTKKWSVYESDGADHPSSG